MRFAESGLASSCMKSLILSFMMAVVWLFNIADFEYACMCQNLFLRRMICDAKEGEQVFLAVHVEHGVEAVSLQTAARTIDRT